MKDFMRRVWCGFAFAVGTILLASFFLSLIAVWFAKMGIDIPLVFIW
jgi:hypothetical protein